MVLTYILVCMLVAHEKKRRARDAERKRERLLQAAFREIHRSGFQSKEALGYALVEEKIAKLTHDRWLRPMRGEGEAIDILIGVVRRIPDSPQDVRAGCPLLLLSQEMSPLDEQFRKRLERIFLDWQKGVATLLRKGKSQGTVRRDLNPDETASFLIATVEGYATLAKNAQDAKVWKAGIRNIVGWLRSLRPPDNYKRG